MKTTHWKEETRTQHSHRLSACFLLPATLLFSALAPGSPARAEEPLWGKSASTLGKGFFNVNTEGRMMESRPYNHHGGPVSLTIKRMEAGLMLEYGLQPDVDLSLSLPYFSETIEQRFNGQMNRDEMAGMGEMEIGAKWRFNQSISDSHKDEFALITGLKLPTGDSRMRDSDGSLIDPHLQPNSGNLGGRIGLAANRHSALYRHWLSVMVGAEAGSTRYQRGSTLEVDASSGRRVRRLTRHNQTDWMGLVGLHYRLMGKERENGRALSDSGGSLLAAEVSLLSSSGTRGLRLGVLFPLASNLGQSDAPLKQEIQASFRASF
jgi:hypothetical protein